jgi:hypothetical protein
MKINPKWKWNETEMKWMWKKFQFLLKVKWKRNWNESEIFVDESEMKVNKFFRTFSITSVIAFIFMIISYFRRQQNQKKGNNFETVTVLMWFL